jgi:hypothetical protein
MTLRAARAGSRSERCGERAVGGPFGPRVDRANQSSRRDRVRAGPTRGIGGVTGPCDPQGEAVAGPRSMYAKLKPRTLLAKVKQQRRALPAFLKSGVGRLFWK